jgi:hypothetical protein
MKTFLVTAGDFIFTMFCAGVKDLKRQNAALLGIAQVLHPVPLLPVNRSIRYAYQSQIASTLF